MIATHGLRHSTSGIYMANGATRDDLYRLFKHSSPPVTERYIHDKGEQVQKIAKLIRLFPTPVDCKKEERISS
jgi:integrase